MKLASLAAFVLAAAALPAFADTFKIDPVHSSSVFRIKHMNTTYVYGRITAPEGTVVYDPAKPEASSFEVTFKAANIDTANANRDNHLKSPAFFDAKEYPTLHFKSTSVKKGQGDALEVSGELTIRGTTKPITVQVEHTGDGKLPNGQAISGFESTFTINRMDYGVKEMPGGVGDDVRIMISLECQKK